MRFPLVFLLCTSWMALGAEPRTFEPKIDAELSDWVVEQMPGGSVTAHDGVLEIKDVGGCTVWLRRPLSAPVEISYEAMVVNEGKPGERVSDLNCFWMAQDPKSPADLFASTPKRTGAFADYDHLATYYVGYGGNTNTTTRFRRYAGDGTRPLLPEHDLHDPKFLLKANHWVQIKLIARAGNVEFIRDGEAILKFKDPKFLDHGWFGLRTVSSHLRIRQLRITTAK